MLSDIMLVALIAVTFAVGIYFRGLIAVVLRIIGAGASGLKKRERSSLEDTRNAKLIATLFGLLAIAIASWSANYYVKVNQLNLIWGDIAVAVFGVATAGLLGGIVFELFLRRELLAEVGRTLAEILTTDKRIAKELFSTEKRNQIIETMLQLNTGSEIYGSALYKDFVSTYTEGSVGSEREFRFDFKDHLSFFNLPIGDEQVNTYFAVTDRLTWKTELRSERFIVGCASNEEQLYSLFSDPRCIYRWLLITQPFKELMLSERGFNAKLIVDDVECQMLEKKIGERGCEIHFQNPIHISRADAKQSPTEMKLAHLQLDVWTLHAREERYASIHLAYPVKGIELVFDYSKCDIEDITRLHFMTLSKNRPRIMSDMEPIVSESIAKQHRRTVTLSEESWLFPTSGIVIGW